MTLEAINLVSQLDLVKYFEDIYAIITMKNTARICFQAILQLDVKTRILILIVKLLTLQLTKQKYI